MAQNMNQANIGLLPLWRSLGNTGDLPVGWNGPGGNTSTNTSSSTPSTPSIDPIALAGSLQQMQVQANQPAIATLGSQQSSLKDQYTSLLNSVLGQGSVNQNLTIAGANSELAKRGITGDSFLANQTIGSALLPVTAQNQMAAAQVGQGSAQDLNQLAAEIAGLQAGNVQGAIGAAPAFAGLAALPSQIALTQAQTKAAPFVPIQQGGFLFGPDSGTLINPMLMALKQLGINITG